MPTTYQRPHRPIDSVSGDIRLISLKPSTTIEADIHCELIDATLTDPPPYEALSYVCGDPSITRDLFLDGVPVPVTTNLESALRHLRQETQPRILWTDALCIDQGNMGELRDQIGHMSEIYKFCKQDIVWLGPANPNLGAPFDK